jgi:hypothetical protein
VENFRKQAPFWTGGELQKTGAILNTWRTSENRRHFEHVEELSAHWRHFKHVEELQKTGAILNTWRAFRKCAPFWTNAETVRW